ncbi:cobyrinate a,c-diamide synthase [Bacillus alveayuensis]|uniref:cobyrinate a,c-diamide synthase n=1 Tax=Aeribacillus alveayuensis TaxID=279215 RepID=UPI0005D111E1|nr:cobyrinate a,c-diamide synthase [Bacillus alveayuensis]
MSRKRMIIAGTGSGVGKTTITLGIMSALRKRGYTVQGFKCGPDYIDPTYHEAVTGRASRNLDSWMLSAEALKEVFIRGSEGADISIIEGMMGLFDGKDPLSNQGSTAEVSILTKSPVLLVVNCAAMARSVAAVVKGFQAFSQETNIAGVIVNEVGSEGHYHIVKSAIEQECGIPVIGYVKQDEALKMPERHLGLIPSIERGELNDFFEQLGKLLLETVDIDKLYQLADAPTLTTESAIFQVSNKKRVKIAVAKDAAFHFYYPENIELLEAYGAECIYFSPLNGEVLPTEVHGLYIGGGFPEEFAESLSANEAVKNSIKNAIVNGIPTLAECGGFMYLAKSITTTDGKEYPMVGVIPAKMQMHSKLAAVGYREITGCEGNFLIDSNMKAKGHEFHYSTSLFFKEISPAYETNGWMGRYKEGYVTNNVVAGYMHLHFASCPKIAENFVNACERRKTHE